MEWLTRNLPHELFLDRESILLAGGAALLIVTIALVWEIAGFGSAREPVADSSPAPEVEPPREYRESPKASEILAAINHAKPELKDGLRENYLGRHVRWTLRLSSMCKMLSGNEACSTYTMFMLSGTKLKAVSVCFDIDIHAHPFLKTARVNEAFTVEGIIQDFPMADVVRLKDIHSIRKTAAERSINPPASSAHTADSLPHAG
ncbi:MAG: hypothetical protein WA532_14510 [Candidatus Korobacteraceae bacterium]